MSEWYWTCIQGVQKDSGVPWCRIFLVITHTEKEKQAGRFEGKCET
jgi:hypothetical protein